MKSLSILGSTGSVGTQTLDIVRQHPSAYRIIALTTQTRIELLKKQIDEFHPSVVVVVDKVKAQELQSYVSIPVCAGSEGLNAVARLSEADIVVNALVGAVGILPTHYAIQNKKIVALANKETLVAAGAVIMQEAARQEVAIFPLDSEHNALFQCLKGEQQKDVARMILTCSGGPFRTYAKEQLKTVTVQDALKHPTWNMGSKITIDSATLMNKGFEVIEAHWLFGIGYDIIEVVVHPQSIIHSLVEFVDHSVLAQLSVPDMRLPIQYALTYPNRYPTNIPSLNLSEIGNLEFSQPDYARFPCLQYAYDAGKQGGTMPAVLNAANEVAVWAFLNNKIQFIDIPRIILTMLEKHKNNMHPSIEDIIEVDKITKEQATALIQYKVIF